MWLMVPLAARRQHFVGHAKKGTGMETQPELDWVECWRLAGTEMVRQSGCVASEGWVHLV